MSYTLIIHITIQYYLEFDITMSLCRCDTMLVGILVKNNFHYMLNVVTTIGACLEGGSQG